jgi:hypothetical protein
VYHLSIDKGREERRREIRRIRYTVYTVGSREEGRRKKRD